MNTPPAISLIIPVYNAEKYIKFCLESICLQSFPDFEVILIDDHSTDSGPEIIAEAAKHDERICYIRPEAKLGPGGARNVGISVSKGKYLCFVDADDTLPENSLELRFHAIETHISDVVYAASNFYKDDTVIYVDRKTKNPRVNISLHENIGFLPTLTHGHWGCIFSREFVTKHQCKYGKEILGQDMCFLLSVLFSNPRITIIPDIVYNWRIHPDSRYNTKKDLQKIKALFYPYSYVYYLDSSKDKLYANYFVKNRLSKPKDLLFLLDLNIKDRFIAYTHLNNLIAKNDIIKKCIGSKNKHLESILLPSHVKFIIRKIATKQYWLANFSLLSYSAKSRNRRNVYTIADDFYTKSTKALKKLLRRKAANQKPEELLPRLIKQLSGQVEQQSQQIKLLSGQVKQLSEQVNQQLSKQGSETQDFVKKKVSQETAKLISELREQSFDIIECLGLFKVPQSEKSVLIVEAENWHAEVLPGYCKYFLDLGYSVTAITGRKNYNMRPFSRISTDWLTTHTLTLENTKKLLSTPIVKKFDYLVFTTRTFIIKGENRTPIHVFDYMPDLVFPKRKVFTVEHHYELLEREDGIREMETVIIPSMCNPKNSNTISVNPHFFGELNYPPKNTITKFISVGNFEQKRRNMDLLFSTMQELYTSGVTNFEVILVSRNQLPDMLPENISRFIQYHHAPSFNTMLQCIEASDFILPLLDPGIEEHKRYLYDATSGTFQLMHGLAKPCIIHQDFAGLHKLNAKNSLVYATNDELSIRMRDAITMSTQKYDSMRECLIQLTESVYNESLNNLKSKL